MKGVATITLLFVLSTGCTLPAAGQSPGVAEYARQSKIEAKKQEKNYRKSAKQQAKAIRKHEKQQRKAAKKMNRSGK